MDTCRIYTCDDCRGCASPSQIDREHVSPGDPVIGLLSKGIAQLNVNINALSRRMNDVQQAPAGTDPVLREMQALDLSGWQLHQQQWVLQRDHLVLARDILQQAYKTKEKKNSCSASGANTGSST